MTVKQVAAIRGCSEQTIRNEIRAGALRASRLTSARESEYRIARADLEAYAKARRAHPTSRDGLIG